VYPPKENSLIILVNLDTMDQTSYLVENRVITLEQRTHILTHTSGIMKSSGSERMLQLFSLLGEGNGNYPHLRDVWADAVVGGKITDALEQPTKHVYLFHYTQKLVEE
jgi:hypothetical protein